MNLESSKIYQNLQKLVKNQARVFFTFQVNISTEKNLRMF